MKNFLTSREQIFRLIEIRPLETPSSYAWQALLRLVLKKLLKTKLYSS